MRVVINGNFLFKINCEPPSCLKYVGVYSEIFIREVNHFLAQLLATGAAIFHELIDRQKNSKITKMRIICL